MAEQMFAGRLSGAWGASASEQLTDPVQRDLNLMDGTWYADDPHAVWSWLRASNFVGGLEGIPVRFSPSACEYA
jgi:hypothetical protein